MKFESAPKINNSVEESANPRQEVINEVMKDAQNFSKTIEGKMAAWNKSSAEMYKEGAKTTQDGHVRETFRGSARIAHERYKNNIENFTLLMEDKIGANQERVDAIITRTKDLSESKKKLFKVKLKNKLSSLIPFMNNSKEALQKAQELVNEKKDVLMLEISDSIEEPLS